MKHFAPPETLSSLVEYRQVEKQLCHTKLDKIKVVSIYHTSEQYFSRALIGKLGGDQPSTNHLRAAEGKQNGFCRYIVTNKVTLWPLVIMLVWYILKQLFTSVSVKVVDINLATSPLGKYPPPFTSTSVSNCRCIGLLQKLQAPSYGLLTLIKHSGHVQEMFRRSRRKCRKYELHLRKHAWC